MHYSKIKAFLLILPLLVVLSLAGCWDKQELREIAIVIGLGFDRTDRGELQITVELAQRESGQESGKSICFTACGKDRHDAEQALEQQLDKTLFWGNLSLLIFGGSIEESDLTALALALYQDGRINSATPLFRSPDQAAAVLNGSFGEAAYVSQGLVQAMEHEQGDQNGQYNLADHLEQLLSGAAERQPPSAAVDGTGHVYLEVSSEDNGSCHAWENEIGKPAVNGNNSLSSMEYRGYKRCDRYASWQSTLDQLAISAGGSCTVLLLAAM